MTGYDPDRDGSVRPATHEDAAPILALEAHFSTDRMSLRSVRRFLKADNGRVWVAELHGVVVGALIGLTRKRSRLCRIYSVVVAPEARGRRLAQRLVAALERQIGAQHLGGITLEVRSDNTAARALYRKLGYDEIAALPGFYEDGGDGLKLRKMLVECAD